MHSPVLASGRSLDHAVSLLREHADARVLAGGQSLIAALKLGLAAPSHLIDLQTTELRDCSMTINETEASLCIGALVTHASMSSSAMVKSFCPMLAALAHGIGDQQIRNMGTIGGSLAHNDPAACWPSAILAMDAQILTTQRTVGADDFFKGVYETTLRKDEIITSIRFPHPVAAHYIKFEQKASRFAVVGVTVVRFPDRVRVAMTGLGHGVTRWLEVEDALTASFTQASVAGTGFHPSRATSDLHASASYRVHLARVLTRRCVQAITNETDAPLVAVPRIAQNSPQGALFDDFPFHHSHQIPVDIDTTWAALLNPEVLRQCIPGCEHLEETADNGYTSILKIGFGPIAARFNSTISLEALNPPISCTLRFLGDAGVLGAGRGMAKIKLVPLSLTTTMIHWGAEVETSGKIAQLGSRLMQATAHKLSRDFFDTFARTLGATPAIQSPTHWWYRLLRWMKLK